ncbi:helicase [Zygosaccharomyces mellis]|uniref:DNA repair and recombination protein RDH54 n=1 Tax=Zygosaccharomyces mellis TaxID=42258 RepID=A0A4C2E2Y9_9SACH|nr:helicase [Zygosaccharomyces mellis]
MKLPTYVNRPFRPPRRVNSAGSDPQVPSKRQTETTPSKDVKRSKQELPPVEEDRKYFTIMYRKPTTKKHKTWNGDGFAQLKQGNRLAFYNESGKYFGSTGLNGPLESYFDNVSRAGSLEVQLDYQVTDSKELNKIRSTIETGNESAGSLTSKSSLAPSPKSSPPRLTPKVVAKFRPSVKVSRFQTPTTKLNLSGGQTNEKYLPVFDINKIEDPIVMNKSSRADVEVVVDPMLSKLLRPHQRDGVKFMYDCVMGLARPEDGIDTASTSLTLENDSDIQGCILADEMGLGKTLMTITLVWTLLKQTPMASKVTCSQNGVPLHGLCNKILIVCPVTLIANWKREFGKWLNLSRIGILTLSLQNNSEKDSYDVKNFLRVQRTYQVLIIGYEKLLSVADELENGKDVIDLLVCDEGHRLKNGSSKVLNILKNLDIPRKILLSGTPIQNDLNEFFTIIDFINPGVLGSYSFFKKRFMTPITKARDPANRFNLHVVEKGQERSEEMISITKRFILRRTNSILAKYLPPKMDIILFCKPTNHQISAFKDILLGANVDLQHLNFNSSLALITLLKKICNSPTLIQTDSYYKSNIQNNKISRKYLHEFSSGKLKVLMKLLSQIKVLTPMDKVVVISNYTQTLDIIENLLISAGMNSCRLDGSTPAKQRDAIVNNFNHNPSIFIFLLSAKSGGVGLNLVGACRLILFDNDWNPSVDLQAMSRIHRDGQKKPCYIYRLVTTGCIDEKILQRQLMKNCLSQKFLSDTKSTKGNADDDLFNKEDLKDLFTVLVDTPSNTHDLICSCDGVGEEITLQHEQDSENNKNYESSSEFELSKWNSAFKAQKVMEELEENSNKSKTGNIKKCLIGYKHIDPKKTHDLLDNVATEVLGSLQNDITFAFVLPGKNHLEETTHK